MQGSRQADSVEIINMCYVSLLGVILNSPCAESECALGDWDRDRVCLRHQHYPLCKLHCLTPTWTQTHHGQNHQCSAIHYRTKIATQRKAGTLCRLSWTALFFCFLETSRRGVLQPLWSVVDLKMAETWSITSESCFYFAASSDTTSWRIISRGMGEDLKGKIHNFYNNQQSVDCTWQLSWDNKL